MVPTAQNPGQVQNGQVATVGSWGPPQSWWWPQYNHGDKAFFALKKKSPQIPLALLQSNIDPQISTVRPQYSILMALEFLDINL